MQISSDICRICFELPETRLVSLNDQILNHQKSYLELYQDVLGLVSILETGSENQLPSKLCGTCSTDLVEAYEFKKRIETSERLLTKIITKEVFDEERKEAEIKISPEIKPKKKYVRRVKLFECSYCEFTCKRATGLARHHKCVHAGALMHCLYCYQRFDLSYRLESHMKKDHPAAFCPDQAIIPINQEYIQSKSTFSGPIPCQHCSKTFVDLFNLSFHCRVFHPETALPCSNCPLVFYIPRQLDQHILAYHTQKANNAKDAHGNSICPHCGKYMNARSLQGHINTVHCPNRKPFICDLCGVKLSTKSILVIHMQTIHLNIIYACRYCNESFKNRIQRRSHEIRLHTFNYKHRCNICEKPFLTNVELQKHRVVHTGEKNFRCDVCGMRFGHRPAFAEHMTTHRETKDFVCQICDAAFKSRRTLRKHGAIHKEFNYECPVCMHRFLENKSMRKHCEKKHPEYQLPPKGTIMNKQAIQKLTEFNAKYNANVTYLNLPKCK